MGQRDPLGRTPVVLRELSNEVLFEVSKDFVSGVGPSLIAKNLLSKHGLEIKRERVYKLLDEARRRNLWRLQVPASANIGRGAADYFGIDPEVLHIVHAPRQDAADQVAYRAAEIVLQRVHEIFESKRGSKDRRVRLGFGGGRLLRTFSRHLAKLLFDAGDVPPLAVHALSAGFEADRPQNAPITFFGSFDGVAHDLEYVGLFSDGFLYDADPPDLLERPGIADALKHAPNIDLIVTSVGSADDEEAALRRFFRAIESPAGRASRAILEERRWTGDLLYQPFSDQGPIADDLPVRPVSLFRLQDLVDRVQRRGQQLVLAVAPTPSSASHRHSRARALAALLRAPELQVWTEVVVDLGTLREAGAPA